MLDRMTVRSWRTLSRSLQDVALVPGAIAGIELVRTGDLDGQPWWAAYVALQGLVLAIDGQAGAQRRQHRSAAQADAASA
jgi:hypothetical protein